MKRFSFLTCLFVMLSMVAKAAEGDVIKVVFDGSSASVTIPATAAVTSTISNGYVTLRSTSTAEEYVYDIYGSTTDGGLTITGNYKLTLKLNGVSITSTKGAAIDVECGKRIGVVLVEGTESILADCVNGSQKGAFYTTGHAEFSGSGTLNVTGNTKHAICAKEYLQIKKSVGTINVLSAVSDGIHCGKGKEKNENNYFQMNGGTLNISNTGSDCIDSDDYGTILIKGGTLNLTVSATDGDGIKADSILTITDGTINIDVTGESSSAIKSDWLTYIPGGKITINVTGNGSKGIKGNLQTVKTVNNGGSVTFSDSTDVTIIVSGSSIFEGTDETKCMGLSVDANLTHTGGSVYILAKGGESYTYSVKGTESTTTGFVAEYESSSSVASLFAAQTPQAESVYSVSGARQSQLRSGINIVRSGDGTIKKIYVK